MPLPNRVSPAGEIRAVPERGLLMGNRGCIHTRDRQLNARPWALKRWIICRTAWKGKWRPVMAPGMYTELFFLDEATALAAGHRPCMECRRAELLEFKAAWLRGNPNSTFTGHSSLTVLDDILHAERLDAQGSQRLFQATIGDLPDGVMVSRVAVPDVTYLWYRQKLYHWTFGGYLAASAVAPDQSVLVRTPPSTVRTLAAGYRPILHSSVHAATLRTEMR